MNLRPSRRESLLCALGVLSGLRRRASATDGGIPVRLAISESILGDVNLNDARVAMNLWIKRMVAEVNVVLDPKLFSPIQDIVDRARRGQLDAIALNVIEYRLIAELLDPSQIVTAQGGAGVEQYLILAREKSGVRSVGDLKGQRFCMLKTPKMCIAPAWLQNLLEEARLGPPEQFFSVLNSDAKVSRVVLPVFFGQTDACMVTRHGFDMTCELNPQIGRDLKIIATSAPVVVNFYIFRKNFQAAPRERLIRTISGLRNGSAGDQLATLFQFDALTVRDGSSLTSALAVLEQADRLKSRSTTAGHK